MTPEGPYRSKWTSGDFFLTSDVKAGEIVYIFVYNGKQKNEGIEFPSIRDARQYIRDNGFQLE